MGVHAHCTCTRAQSGGMTPPLCARVHELGAILIFPRLTKRGVRHERNLVHRLQKSKLKSRNPEIQAEIIDNRDSIWIGNVVIYEYYARSASPYTISVLLPNG